MLGCSDLEVMLQSSDFEKPPENSQMSADFITQLEDCSTGSVAFVYQEKGELVLLPTYRTVLIYYGLRYLPYLSISSYSYSVPTLPFHST